MNIAEALQATPVATLDLTRYVEVGSDSTIAATVAALADAGLTCACVMEDDRLAGIFTQRDFLMRVIGRRSVWDRPITEVMTNAVKTMRADQTAAEGLGIMNDWWVRSVPVVDDDGRLIGNLSFYTLISLIGKLIAARLEGSGTEGPGVQHGLDFIDFTGLNTSSPVTVLASDTIETAVHHMRNRAIGSLLVTDERGSLVGTITEFDLLTKVGCDVGELDTVVVSDHMTPDPVVLSSRSPISSAIGEIIENRFSHIPLVGESGRPVGVTSVRDIAAYIETSLASLA